MKSAAIILAAGQGTRMKSKYPKVMHKLFDKHMLSYILSAVEGVKIEKKIVVLGHGADEVRQVLDKDIQIAHQKEQLGTGHAVLQAQSLLTGEEEYVLVLCGDTPLLRAETLERLISKHQQAEAALTILTANLSNPTGYGRIIRNGEGVQAIVEEKDASLQQKEIKEINTGAYCFRGDFLIEALQQLTNDNAQGEYYLTDLVELAVQKGLRTRAYILDDAREGMGINNRIQLAEAQKILGLRFLEKLMLEGVTIIDPQNTYISGDVQIGKDTIIYPGVYLEGKTTIGKECLIGPHTRIVDSKIGNNVEIQNTVILESSIADNCKIGPFAYIRPGTVIENNVKIGDFVEIKKSTISEGSKVPHLSYIGDAYIGKKVNIGCGTITCNYDGKQKHKTIIHDHAFIGSNTNLVAPITIGKSAIIGAGSTITKEVPQNSLSVGRGRQKNIENWVKNR